MHVVGGEGGTAWWCVGLTSPPHPTLRSINSWKMDTLYLLPDVAF